MWSENHMTDDAIIRIDGMWKRYGLPLPRFMRHGRRQVRSLVIGDNPQSAIRNPDDDGPWALRDINLEVRRGDTLGIIGRNGAGKSTLLKVLAGVTPPTRGQVEVRGRIFPMIELNAGVHPELTGRENVFLLGAVMGLSRRDMIARAPMIEEFCELGSWFDGPVRQYSSGMLARLGFGVAIYADADILLIDEVLAVGDFAFQKKCVNHIARLGNQGVTTVFVSHNPYILERMCDRAILLRTGEMEEIGNPLDVIYRYFEEAMDSKGFLANGGLPPNTRPGTGDLRIQKIEILNAGGQRTDEVYTGEALTIRVHYEIKEALWEPNFSIRIIDPHNAVVLAFDSTASRKGKEIRNGGYIDCIIQELPLMPNIYTVQVKVAGDVLLDAHENAGEFGVKCPPKILVDSGGKGIVFAKANWRFS